jgi:hypothetical protein
MQNCLNNYDLKTVADILVIAANNEISMLN